MQRRDAGAQMRAPFVLVRQHFGATLFDARTHEYHSFGHDEARSLFALASARASDSAMRASDNAMTEELARRGWLALDGTLRARVIDHGTSTPRDHLVGPMLVHVEVNAVCNLACAHCFASPLPRSRGDVGTKGGPLSVAELDGVFAQMSALGSMRVSLTGGEPLMRADLLAVVDAAIAHDLSVSLTTNGLLIDDAWARSIRARIDSQRVQWLNVSLDGATPATNDVVRGAGTFERVLDRLTILRANDVPFSLAFTLMQTNLHEVEACVVLAARVGAGTAVFRPLYPVGAARHRPDLWPSRDDVERAFARINAVASGSMCGIATDNGGGCGAGSTILSLDVEGRASPCGFMGDAFLGPSVRDASLEHLWSSRHFSAVRGDGFAGGCRARALVHDGVDPWTRPSRSLPIVTAL